MVEPNELHNKLTAECMFRNKCELDINTTWYKAKY